jgi:lipopolysaccharide transport system ATP-binding protein
MSSDNLAIEVTGLGKCYEIYERPQDRLRQMLWLGRRRFYREFWALRDVSFHVKRGETLGVIGRNGSGKSTLLELICGTLTPTEGQVKKHGRIGALLELGAGFNPEFTGRENVYLNGTVMGLTQEEISDRYAGIASFAEIGDFIDQPVKTYSTGMYIRLAFAVAIHVEPEILIIDEALSVGDMLFQFKCFTKFQELQKSGKTILFVTHDLNAIKQYCSRVLLLEGGQLIFEGSPNDAANRYTKILFPAGIPVLPANPGAPAATVTEGSTPSAAQLAEEEEPIETSGREYRYGSGEGEIAFIDVRNSQRERTVLFTAGEHMSIRFRAIARRSLEHPILAMTIKDFKGQEVYVTNTLYKGVPVPDLNAGDEVDATFTQHLRLAPNTYFLSLGFVYVQDGNIVPMDRRYDVLEIKVLPRTGDKSHGIADLDSEISVKERTRCEPLDKPAGRHASV